MPLFKRRGCKNLSWRFTYQGKTYTKSFGTRNAEITKTLGQKWELDVKYGNLLPRTNKIMLYDLAEAFLDYLQKKYSPSHYLSTRGRLYKWILPYFGNVDVGNIDRAKIENFLLWRQEQVNYNGRYPQKSEIAHTLKALKTMFNRLIDGTFEGFQFSKPNPCKGIQIKIPQQEKFRVLSKVEVNRILSYKGFMADPLLFMIDTGCRPGECFNLKWDQVHLSCKEEAVKIFASKTENERLIPLTTRVSAMLKKQVRFFNSPLPDREK